jgi:segregation and condensation protein B
VGHRDVPGKPELLGTTKDFLDYFGLKKLDDLPTLSQLKELEDLRLQLSLPEPAPAAALPAVDGGAVHAEGPRGDEDAQGELETHAEDDEEQSEDLEHAAGHSQGLVARGVHDDAH